MGETPQKKPSKSLIAEDTLRKAHWDSFNPLKEKWMTRLYYFQ